MASLENNGATVDASILKLNISWWNLSQEFCKSYDRYYDIHYFAILSYGTKNQSIFCPILCYVILIYVVSKSQPVNQFLFCLVLHDPIMLPKVSQSIMSAILVLSHAIQYGVGSQPTLSYPCCHIVRNSQDHRKLMN